MTSLPPGVPVIVVAGPTASGKSGLALEIAARFGGTIINADAMQVYRGLAVLTAAPGADDMARVPHLLYGVVDPAEPCSAGRWRAMAVDAIAAVAAAGRLPVVVGGTGLYLRALMSGIAEIPPVPPAIREAVRTRLRQLGAPALHAELAAGDPAAARRLAPRDGQRIARALEVLAATGRPLSDWAADAPAAGAGPGWHFFATLLMPSRDDLYAAIDARFARMVAAGGLDEVRALAARKLAPALPAMKALGVPELLRHLAGEIDLGQAIAAGQQATRRYAKRQITWFRHQLVADLVMTQHSESMNKEIFSKISGFLLTPVR